MIRRSVRARFRNVYWTPFDAPAPPLVFAANHQGWHDGYLMYVLVTRLGVRCLDWIAEFDAFPLFARIGGMPFPPDRPDARAATIRRTIRLMREERRSLVLFPEARLHPGPELLPFDGALDLVARRVPEARVVPVAIRYVMGVHERPEAFLRLGEPLDPGPEIAARTREAVLTLLAAIDADRREGREFEVLASGMPDVNERMDMRRLRRR